MTIFLVSKNELHLELRMLRKTFSLRHVSSPAARDVQSLIGHSIYRD